jgi:hypothetical protein
MTNEKNMKDFHRILNLSPYFLFLIATEPKEVFTDQKWRKETKREEMKKNDLWMIFSACETFFPFFWQTSQEFLIVFLISYS